MKSDNQKRDSAARFEVWMDATRSWWRNWTTQEGAACSQWQVGDMMREAFEAGFNTAQAESAAQPQVPELAKAYDQALTEATGSILSKYAADKLRDRAIAIALAAAPKGNEEKP